MLKAGTSWVVPTWLAKSTTKHMRHISRLYTGTAAIRRFGVQSVSCTSKSTSSATHWMPTRGQFVSTHTSPKSGLISAACTRAATTRYLTPSMPMREPASLILATTLSPNACSFSRLRRLPAASCLLRRVHKMSTLPLTPVLLSHLQGSQDRLSFSNQLRSVHHHSGPTPGALLMKFLCHLHPRSELDPLHRLSVEVHLRLSFLTSLGMFPLIHLWLPWT